MLAVFSFTYTLFLFHSVVTFTSSRYTSSQCLRVCATISVPIETPSTPTHIVNIFQCIPVAHAWKITTTTPSRVPLLSLTARGWGLSRSRVQYPPQCWNSRVCRMRLSTRASLSFSLFLPFPSLSFPLPECITLFASFCVPFLFVCPKHYSLSFYFSPFDWYFSVDQNLSRKKHSFKFTFFLFPAWLIV